MSFIPKSLLRKLYVKGSLENVDLTARATCFSCS